MDPGTHPYYDLLYSRLPHFEHRFRGHAVNHHLAKAHIYRTHNHCGSHSAIYHTGYNTACHGSPHSTAAYRIRDLSSCRRRYLLGRFLR